VKNSHPLPVDVNDRAWVMVPDVERSGEVILYDPDGRTVWYRRIGFRTDIRDEH
jgi:hypothetical protein